MLRVKSGPPDAKIFLDGEELGAITSAAGIRSFSLSGAGSLRFHAEGYADREFSSRELPGLLRNGRLEIKLEKADSFLTLIQEAATGWQPKSACFSPEGDRVFVPLLGRSGIDVFRLAARGEADPNLNTIVLSPDGTRLFVSSRGRNNPGDYTLPGPEFGTVSALSPEDLSIEETIWGRNQPTGLAVSPDGNYMVFTDFLDANLELYNIGGFPKTSVFGKATID
jgi:hypothetical protein